MSLLSDFDLFIFDWDGTISTSTFFVRFTRFFKPRYNLHYVEKHKAEYSPKSLASIKVYEEEHELFSRLYEIYSHFLKPKLKPGAKEAIEILKKNKKKIAVFSDGMSFRLIKEARMLSFYDMPDIFLSADSIKCYKPNPTGLLLIAEKFRIKKSRVIYVGDAASDVLTARFAGMHVASVADGVDLYNRLKAVQPDYLFHTIRELAEALKE